MSYNKNGLAQAGMALGVGLIAGLAGTAAVTISRKLDKQCAERKPEKALLEVASKVLDIQPTSEEKQEKVVEEIHWAYGASKGILRGALNIIGINGVLGTAAHFATIWYAEKILLPDAKKVFPDVKGSKPITEIAPYTLARDSMHQALYAAVTGLVFDFIMPDNSMI